jgi:phosphoenolpyruvate synthase/pyruvate phosphate dikinase
MPRTFETYLNVKGEDDVVKHIIKVWASTFNAQDLEWVFDTDMDSAQNLFLVQTRNISVIKEKKTDADIYGKLISKIIRF